MWREFCRRLKLRLLRAERNRLFDICRRTGGESSPFLEDYLAIDREIQELSIVYRCPADRA